MTAPADEAWKVMICAQETKRAQEVLSFLGYMLGNGMPGVQSSDEMLASISGRTGKQIADCIEAYIRSRLDSIAVAIKSKG